MKWIIFKSLLEQSKYTYALFIYSNFLFTISASPSDSRWYADGKDIFAPSRPKNENQSLLINIESCSQIVPVESPWYL